MLKIILFPFVFMLMLAKMAYRDIRNFSQEIWCITFHQEWTGSLCHKCQLENIERKNNGKATSDSTPAKS